MSKPKNESSKSTREITFHHTFAPYFRNLYANGVFGGINPHGEIMMNFYLEKIELPEEIKYKVTKKSGLEELSRTPKIDKKIREAQVGIVLNLTVARSVKNWLEEKIALMESSLTKAKDELQ